MLRRLLVGSFVAVFGFSVLFSAVPALCLAAADPCALQHPLDPPDKELQGQCLNCGMGRPMWARTWMTYENSQGASEVCSFHCLADIAIKSGEDPRNVMVAEYTEPGRMTPAENASFVVGSKAKGTMTMTSKIAFVSAEEAQKFAQTCDGKVMTYSEVLALAKESISKENKAINERRIKTGKIVEPVDNKDECIVCKMYPARYPNNKCQLQTQDGEVYHFCSTQCLFAFLSNSAKYATTEVKPAMVWTVDYPTGTWIGSKTAYYVVGSKTQGPMGPEAFVFDRLEEAKSFAAKEGGEVLTMKEVTPDRIMAK
ncbi:MAG: nitrous oxide reductase accessory protein NosL [Desulforhabdus sp.]|jgi:nitrous oxide reductase accessory protein NosL|nr:nitrous oxide reductase accessory protein NosL [Desulforhabdus sp.]